MLRCSAIFPPVAIVIALRAIPQILEACYTEINH
jgi:hypothetical protein